jgi:hypothetical protein
MGQFLHIGLVYQIAFDKKEFDKTKLTLPEVTAKIDSTFLVNSNLYEMEIDTDGDYIFTLKKNVMEAHFLAFLEVFYTEFYGNDTLYYESILAKLQDKTAEDWIKMAERKYEEAYQMSDRFDTIHYLYFDDKPFCPELELHFRAITLAMAGKILMEAYYKMFGFFTKNLQTTFAQNPLSQTLKIYIS